MRRFKLSLFNFFAIVTCLILLTTTFYERHRANEIVKRSIVLDRPELRALVVQQLKILDRQIEIAESKRQLDAEPARLEGGGNGFTVVSRESRVQQVNILNSMLKLEREKLLLDSMTDEVAAMSKK